MATEFVDNDQLLNQKYGKVLSLIQNAGNVAFFTGAGVSTAGGIPDFRGDHGLDKNPLNIVEMGISERDLDCKMPTYAHCAIAQLMRVQSHKFRFVGTSNHDGLHQKAGTQWSKSANVFGTAYIEECMSCHTRYTRGVIVPALYRKCEGCGGKMKKTGVRYGQTVPVGPLRRAEAAAGEADLVIVLGSSMRTHPFCDLPSLAKSMVICNRQDTPYDSHAKVCVHDAVDHFMRRVLEGLGIRLTQFEYSQEFVIKEEADYIIITTPRPYEPAVFIVDACVGNSSFQQGLDGVFSLSADTVPDQCQVVIEFKEGFGVDKKEVTFVKGKETRDTLHKIVTF